MVAVSLFMGVLGAASHAFALYGYYTWQIPNKLCAPQATQYLGSLTWLTFQTNVLCMCYFAAAVFSHVFDSTALSSIVVHGFPLALTLGFALSIMYYGLDHFNPENVQKRKTYVPMGYHHVELACHVEHGMSTPIAVLNACTIALPATVPVNGVVLPFMGWYIALSLVNRAATRAWAYPIIDDVQRAAGWPGVLLFFGSLAGLFVGFAHLGNWIAALRLA